MTVHRADAHCTSRSARRSFHDARERARVRVVDPPRTHRTDRVRSHAMLTARGGDVSSAGSIRDGVIAPNELGRPPATSTRSPRSRSRREQSPCERDQCRRRPASHPRRRDRRASRLMSLPPGECSASRILAGRRPHPQERRCSRRTEGQRGVGVFGPSEILLPRTLRRFYSAL